MEHIKIGLFTCFFLAFASQCFSQEDLKLWYKKPSGDVWEAALPIGNGRIAGMIYGNPEMEKISLNEATVWSGSPYRNDNPKALQALPRVRLLINEERYIPFIFLPIIDRNNYQI